MTRLHSQIDRAAWTSDIRAPVVLIDRILLVQIDLEELVVRIA